MCGVDAAIAWAFARLGFHPGPLLGSLAARIAPSMQQLTPKTVSHTVWAFATLDHGCPALMEAVAATSAPRLHLYSTQVTLLFHKISPLSLPVMNFTPFISICDLTMAECI